MAGKKEAKTQMVDVDARKLGQGMKTVFEGVAMVFDAIGAEAGMDSPPDPLKAGNRKGGDSKTTEPPESAIPPEVSDNPSDTPWGSSKEPAVENGADGKKAAEAVKSEEPQDNSAAITLDDVTKIIVQKIKKNRSNNEKIGQILKTYGVAKVGELPDTKYEAFLTDLSEL